MSFNDDQLDYIRDLRSNPERLCPCGWFFKDECAQRCNSTYGSPEKEAEARAIRAARQPEER